MGVYETLEEQAGERVERRGRPYRWVPADAWMHAYEARRSRRLGKALPGLASMISRRPLSESQTRIEEGKKRGG